MNKDTVEGAMSRLANTMRIYVEAFLRYKGLVAIDKEEAINNIDRAWESKLEAFHTLYDVTQEELDYFDRPDSALLIFLRNALHHRNHSLFQSLNSTLWLCDEPERLAGAAYLLANHPPKGGGPSRMHHFIKLEDIYSRLDPRRSASELDRSKKVQSKFRFIEEGLSFEKVWAQAGAERYPNHQVYLDLMPIFISAVSNTLIRLKALDYYFKGYDAGTYESCFTEELGTDLSNPKFRGLRMNGLQYLMGPSHTINEAAVPYNDKGEMTYAGF
jgi:hypothetical protein